MPLAIRLAPLLFLSLALSPALAQDAKALKEENARLRQELEDLRAEKNRLQDERIASERRFDEQKRRLLDEKDKLQGELARIQRDARLEQARLESRVAELEGGPAKGKEPAPEGDPLARRLKTQAVSLNFDGTSLAEALEFLRDITGLKVEVDPALPEALTITIKIRDIPLGSALTLVLDNLRAEEGDAPAVEWAREADVIKVRPVKR